MWEAIIGAIGNILGKKDDKNSNGVELVEPKTENIESTKTETNNVVKSNDVANVGEVLKDEKSPVSKSDKFKDKATKFGDTMEKVGGVLSSMSELAENNTQQVPQFQNITPTVVSDERLKDIFGTETPIDCFAKIHAYEFKYTPEAQEMMQGKNHVDDKEHLGVMAQELLVNPATSACVIKDTDGFLKVDTAQLTMANTATIAELSRKVQKLEEMLGER